MLVFLQWFSESFCCSFDGRVLSVWFPVVVFLSHYYHFSCHVTFHTFFRTVITVIDTFRELPCGEFWWHCTRWWQLTKKDEHSHGWRRPDDVGGGSLGHWGADGGWKRLYSRRGLGGRCPENKRRRRRCRRAAAAASESSRTNAHWEGSTVERSSAVERRGWTVERCDACSSLLFLGRFPTPAPAPTGQCPLDIPSIVKCNVLAIWESDVQDKSSLDNVLTPVDIFHHIGAGKSWSRTGHSFNRSHID